MLPRAKAAIRKWGVIGALAMPAVPVRAQDGVPIYQNDVTPQRSASNATLYVLHGGAGTDPDPAHPNNRITKVVMDDVTVDASGVGKDVNDFTFIVVNTNSVAVAARPRVRFWQADGTGGKPGTWMGGFSFYGGSFSTPITFAANSVTEFTAGGGITGITIPANGKLWVGMTFDNLDSAPNSATLAQLNNLGSALYNPPALGSSANQIFVTASQGAFTRINTPAGSLQTVSGAVANLGYSLLIVSSDTAVNGRVIFDGINKPNGGSPGLTIEFRAPGTTNAEYTQQVVASPTTGEFTVFLPINMRGTYDVAIKGALTLRDDHSNLRRAINGPITLNTVTLLGGDANGDNSVDNLDLGILAAAYATAGGDPNFQGRADFNYDGFIDNLDLGILANNYTLTGDD